MFFGLFAPKPPLSAREKAWTEFRMRWLASQFGIDRLLKAQVVRPDDRRLPERYDGTPDDARRLMDCIGRIMGFDASSIQLDICADTEMPRAAGLYEPGLIRVAESQLADPPGLVAVLAHELAHDLLIGRGLLVDDHDGEWVTDLLPVYLGLGIFSANATLCESTERQGNHSWWYLGRRGYLNSVTIGYALALFAWMRSEMRPDWANLLRRDARHTLVGGLRYLEATEDSLFNPHTCRSTTSWHALLEQIDGGSPSACIGGLWELAERPRDARDDRQAEPVIRRHLSNCLPAVRAEAARTLALLGAAAEPAMDDLIQVLKGRDDEARVAAAYALGRLSMQPEKVVPHLVEAMADRDLLRPAAVAVASYASAARPAVPRLASALLRALTETKYADTDCLLHAIEATAADPAAELSLVLAACDAESRPQAEHILANREPVPTGAHAPGAWFGEWSGAY